MQRKRSRWTGSESLGSHQVEGLGSRELYIGIMEKKMETVGIIVYILGYILGRV